MTRPALSTQLSRWCAGGRLIQVRRGLYALAPPYRKVVPSRFLVANRLMPGSFVSTHSALAYACAIPEHVAPCTSCGPGRPHTRVTPLGKHIFQHLRGDFLNLSVGGAPGFRRIEVMKNQYAFVATPEKALLDLAYLTAGADDPRWINQMRLNYEAFNTDFLLALARASQSPKLLRMARYVASEAAAEAKEWVGEAA